MPAAPWAVLLRRSKRPISGANRQFRRVPHHKVLAMLLSVLRSVQIWTRYRANLRELNRLGDRELADIGVSRSDIYRLAWDGAKR
jgi:uncharacterized protein YjiS (DUF1127 family)